MNENIIENTFPIRLKELRLQAKLTQKEMANILNMKQQSYLRYELGTGEPNLSTLRNIAIYFEVSTDYLLGLKDY